MSASLAVDFLTYAHILSAIGWLGGSLLFLVVIGPLLPRFKPATGRDLIFLLFPRFAIAMTVFGGLTILFGLGLLFATVEGDPSQLVLPDPWGLWIPLGALLALVAAFEGVVVMRGYLTRVGALIRAAPEEPRGPPPPEVLDCRGRYGSLRYRTPFSSWQR